VLISCVDGLQGFPEAIEAVYPKAWSRHAWCTSSARACGSCPTRICAPSPAISRRSRPRPRPRLGSARALRRDLGSQISDDLSRLDRALGTDRPLPGLFPRTSDAPSTRRIPTRSRRSTARSARSSRPAASFSSEDSARKLLYLAITRAQRKWRHTYNWTSALTAFRIHFGDRISDTAI
jgi:putative transposase